MTRLLRLGFFGLFVRALVLVVLGLNVRQRQRLPTVGPAIICANHNSHLDTLVLMSLFPLESLPRLRPVAAMDYFLRNRFLAWFALNILAIIPLDRKPRRGIDPLAGCVEALKRGDILILFPEGTRGEPEILAQFKSGIAHLAERVPEVSVVPVFLHGLGKALPKGEAVLVPFFCDVFVGEALAWSGNKREFMGRLDTVMQGLAAQGRFPQWQ